MARGAQGLGWVAAGLASGLHGLAWSTEALTGPWLGALALAFGLAVAALLGLVLEAQRGVLAGRPAGALLTKRLGRLARWGLGAGFFYVALHLAAALPVGGGGGEGFHFDRAFTALLAWFSAAAALLASAPRSDGVDPQR